MNFPIKKIKKKSKNFPFLLKEIAGVPEEIFYIGCLPNKDERLVAVVGTRKATSEGLMVAKEISRDLAASGITIVSGLALGIDGAAHEGALAGDGRTIAVLGNGLHEIYPAEHYNLARKILEKDGCIISEYKEGTPSLPHQFLERNRIISGLSLATVVIEAPIRSGSLVTAKNALEQGREVFVIPGPAGHPNYEGSHMLLREGARLVTSAEEVMEDLGLTDSETTNQETSAKETEIIDEKRKIIFNILRETKKALNIDKIIEITKLEPNIVNQKLTFLILEGLIEENNGKFKIKS